MRERIALSLANLWRLWMLQWKPRLFLLVAVLVLIAASLGQLTWIIDQLTWLD